MINSSSFSSPLSHPRFKTDRQGVSRYLEQCAHLGYRGLVIVTGTQESCFSFCQSLLSAPTVDTDSEFKSEFKSETVSGVWVGGSQTQVQQVPNQASLMPSAQAEHAKSQTISLHHIKTGKSASILGSEFSFAVIDAFSGFNPNDLAQVSGALIAGGAVILLMPPMDQWHLFNDPEYQSLVAPPNTTADIAPRFLPLIRETLSAQRQLWRHIDADAKDATAFSYPWPVSVKREIKPTEEQQSALDALSSQLKRGRRPSVITAERGRGKSTLLGWMAAEQVQAGRRVFITSPSIQGLNSFYKHLALAMSVTLEQAKACVTYLSPYDASQYQAPEGSLLVIDEAAGIPVALLTAINQRFVRCVYATTTCGYEGTGQGFTLRFLPQLRAHSQRLLQQTLTLPVRWSAGDWLEMLVNDLLLLDAKPADISADQLFKAPSVSRVSRQQLSKQDVSDIFGLLVAAHYRTTPGDLRILLDSPNLHLWLAHEASTLVGVVLGVEEGRLDAGLAEKIWQGKRRPKGQLLTQTLIANENYKAAADYIGWRVMRIAVNPSVQRKGIGCLMLAKVEQDAKDAGVDYLGAAFSCYPDTLAFWRTVNYLPASLGVKPDTVTGCGAVTVLKGLNEQGQRMEGVLHQRLVRQVFARLNHGLTWLAFESLAGMFTPQMLSDGFALDEWEILDVVSFATGHKPIDLALPALQKWLFNHLADIRSHVKEADDQALILSIFFNREVYQASDLRRVRQLIAELLSSAKRFALGY